MKRCAVISIGSMPSPRAAAAENAPHEMEDVEADDLIFMNSDTHEFDLTEILRDTLLIAVPVKVLCQEDCRGICSGCGALLNEEPCRCQPKSIDPRFRVLEKLKMDNNEAGDMKV